MMFSALIANLQHDIALLQYYIKQRQEAGFHDMERMVEALAISIFKYTYDLSLRNMNQIKVNFPAIDLADDKAGYAIQVTTDADARKIKKTIKVYESKKLNDKYANLIVLGFCSATKRKDREYCEIIGMGDIITILTDRSNEEDVQNIIDVINQHHDYDKLHPYEDIGCLEIVLNCIDRNAIKHSMQCEGPYTDMVKGLNQITELISTGRINRRSKGKALDNFKDERIKRYLREVRDTITTIMGIINAKKRPESDAIFLDMEDMQKIDLQKRSIVDLSNQIAQSYDIRVQLVMR